jgi:hypothetical protein
MKQDDDNLPPKDPERDEEITADGYPGLGASSHAQRQSLTGIRHMRL